MSKEILLEKAEFSHVFTAGFLIVFYNSTTTVVEESSRVEQVNGRRDYIESVSCAFTINRGEI